VTVISRALEHLATATEAADVLDSACKVFEDLLAVLRRHQEDEVSAFPAFVLAACAAANGRDWTGGVWTQRPDVSKRDAADELLNGATIAEIAVAIATASSELATRLSACALSAATDAERACCERAAAEAATIRALMGGVSAP